MKEQGDQEWWWLSALGQQVSGPSVPKDHQVTSANTSVLNSEVAASQSLVPTVPKDDGAKLRASEEPLSSGMSLGLRGYLHAAPLLPLKVF